MTLHDRGQPELREFATACPFYQHLGMEVEEAEGGSARVTMDSRPELFQFQHALHGGAVFSIADAAVAVALLSLAEPGEDALTIEGKINYFRPVTTGRLVAVGRIVHRGRSIAVGEADVRVADTDASIARGTFTYTLRRRRPTREEAVPADQRNDESNG